MRNVEPLGSQWKEGTQEMMKPGHYYCALVSESSPAGAFAREIFCRDLHSRYLTGLARRLAGVLVAAALWGYAGSGQAQAQISTITLSDPAEVTQGTFLIGVSNLSDLSELASSPDYERNYIATFFTAAASQVYTFGQTSSPVDTVMIVYRGVFDPANPSNGAESLNDDTDQPIHRARLGDPAAVIQCGSSVDYCPQVSLPLTAGEVVSIVITTYRGADVSAPLATPLPLGLPQTFYVDGAGTFAASSAGLAAPATLEQELQAILAGEAERALRSDIAANVRMTRAARERLMESLRREAECAAEDGDDASAAAALRDDCGPGLATRDDIPFRITGSADVSNGVLSTRGSFFGQQGDLSGTSRRLVFGDFDVQHDAATGSTTATVFGRMAWEQMVSPQTLFGYFVGVELGNSRIRSATLSGTNLRYSATVGAYGVHRFGDNLYGDAFVSFGLGRNNLDLGDGSQTIRGNYATRTATFGASISGVVEREGYEIRPDLSFSYGHTWLGTIGVIGTSSGPLSIDAGGVSVGQLVFRPEFRIPLDGLTPDRSDAVLSLTPRLLCESLQATVRRSGCGGGAEIAIRARSVDGLTQVSANLSGDRIMDRSRFALQLSLTHRF